MATNLLTEALTGGVWRPIKAAQDFLWEQRFFVILIFVIVVLLTIVSFWDKRRQIDPRLLDHATVEKAKQLKPGLRIENSDISIADYRSDVYVSRKSDQEAADALESCGGVIVIGRPLSGKTRTALELIRKSPDSLVVIPRMDLPPAFSKDGLRGRDIIMFVDDIHLGAQTLNLNDWITSLRSAGGRTFRIVATSRDGKDWDRVNEHQRRLVQHFGPKCRVYTSGNSGNGTDISVEDGRILATQLGLDLPEGEFERRFDGTPGSLTLNLEEMGLRYKGLSREKFDGAFGNSLINVIKLLHVGGQPRFREEVARAAVETIRGNQPLSNETWDELKRRNEEEGFGVFVEGEFRTYRPYLESPDCVDYQPSKKELSELIPLLAGKHDYEGLFYLGVELVEIDAVSAKLAYQLSADGGFGQAANNLGTMLMEEGKISESETALKQAIQLGANLAYGNLGKLLSDYTDRDKEAEEAFREGAARGNASASFGLGHHLAKQEGREEDAENAFREAITRGDSRALLNLGNLLMLNPARRGEARQLFLDAIAAGHNEGYNSLGALLLEQGDRDGAERVFLNGIKNGMTLCSYNLAEMLMEDPDRWDESEEHYKAAISGKVPGAQLRLGVLLSQQTGKEHAAVIELEKAVDSNEIDGDGYHRLGMALMQIPGRENEADEVLRKAIEAGDQLALNSLGILLADTKGMESQAEEVLRAAARVAPGVGSRNLGILLARQKGREADAIRAFLDSIRDGEVRSIYDLSKMLMSNAGITDDLCSALIVARDLGNPEASRYLAIFCRHILEE